MYKITIEKVEYKQKTVAGNYQIVDERPYTKEELNDTFNPKSLEEQTKKVYGYLKDKEITVETETTVLEQTVDDLDLIAVIKAVNKIKG